MSYKLTVSDRREILEALMNRPALEVKKRQQEIKDAEHVTAEMLYDLLYSPAERRRMKALPEGWLPKGDGMNVGFGTSGERYHFSFGRDREGKQEQRLFPYQHLHNLKRFNLDTPEGRQALELCKAFNKMRDEEKARIEKIRLQSRGILESCTTLNKLCDVWPEIAPVAREICNAPVERTGVPMVIPTELNAALGFKSKKQAAQGKAAH